MNAFDGYESPRLLLALLLVLELGTVVVVVLASLGWWWPVIAWACFRYAVIAAAHVASARRRMRELRAEAQAQADGLSFARELERIRNSKAPLL